MKGLLGCVEMRPDEALLIPDCSSIHTFGMRFAIDAVFVKTDGAIVRVVEKLKPWRLASCGEAEHVIELAAGTAGKAGLAAGQRLAWEK